MDHRSSNTTANVAVLTVSDTRLFDDDTNGLFIEQAICAGGHIVYSREIVPDEGDAISSLVTRWAAESNVDAIIVNGGTGPSPRDVTCDSVLPLMAATLDGFGELFRLLSYKEIGSAAMLSRAVAGWIETSNMRTPVFLLPGAPNGVALAMEELIMPQLGHLIDVCSLEVSQ